MMNNIIEYLENTAEYLGSKTAITDGDRRISFLDLLNKSKRIATGLYERVGHKEAVVICMEKSIEYIEAMLACAQLGIVYIPLDIMSPPMRRRQICDTVAARFIICRKEDRCLELSNEQVEVLYTDDLLEYEVVDAVLEERRKHILVSDPLYIVFTSGSTGRPKGIVATHFGIMCFIDAMAEEFPLTAEDSLANQVPFYFDASTKDIYLMCKCGCTMHIIPKKLFMLPKNLLEFLNEKQITTIIWAPSLLCMVANFKALEKVKPEYLKTVFFVGESMPAKQMNIWRAALPDVRFVNLYGATEVSGSSTYYIISRNISDTEMIPIGIPFRHLDVFLLDDEDRVIDQPEVVGEICIRGSSLSLGYFGDFAKTKSVFVQNPLNKSFADIVYRSGDLGKYNRLHELVYVCRRDYQIKRMGQRIELGEIEAVIGSLKGVDRVCCLFEKETQRLMAIYSGESSVDGIKAELVSMLPAYMLPGEYHKVNMLPLNQNGKVDRIALSNIYTQ